MKKIYLVFIVFILFLISGCEYISIKQIGYQISLTPSNRVLRGERVDILFKVTNNFEDIIILDKIEYSVGNRRTETIDLNKKVLKVGDSELESDSIHSGQFEKGIYPITTKFYYLKGNSTNVVDLSLSLEIY